MAVREVLYMGAPLLLQKAEPVTEFGTPALEALIADMADTMRALNGVGLAAPQIGVSQRVMVFGFDRNPRYPEAEPVPWTVLINPEIVILSEETDEFWEGCLSLPGLRGWVSRSSHLGYSGYDQYGSRFEREVRGFHARVIQHECDHLEGVLYPQRMTDMRQFGFTSALFADSRQ